MARAMTEQKLSPSSESKWLEWRRAPGSEVVVIGGWRAYGYGWRIAGGRTRRRYEAMKSQYQGKVRSSQRTDTPEGRESEQGQEEISSSDKRRELLGVGLLQLHCDLCIGG